jgi:lipopolysaccharide export system protein LptC
MTVGTGNPVFSRLSTWFPLLLLSGLAALTYWLDQGMQQPLSVRERHIGHEPDYTVDRLIATRLDEEGHIRDTLRSAQLVHYPDDDSTTLSQPRFVNFAHGAPLSVTAQEGKVSSNGENLYFSGDVRATRAASATASELVVTTDFLHVMPDDDIVRSNRPVTIRDATLTVHAGGMELHTEKRILKLHAGVRGVYHDEFSAAGTRR